LFLIEATVDGDYTWLGVVIVIGTMVSLAYYLRVIAAVWMRPGPEAAAEATAQPVPAIAGGAPDADASSSTPGSALESGGIPRGAGRCGLVVGAGLLCAAATVVFGVVPSPLIDWASHAAQSLSVTV